jgi:hypothetical protein
LWSRLQPPFRVERFSRFHLLRILSFGRVAPENVPYGGLEPLRTLQRVAAEPFSARPFTQTGPRLSHREALIHPMRRISRSRLNVRGRCDTVRKWPVCPMFLA